MTISEAMVSDFLHARSERPRWLPVAQKPATAAEGYALQKAVHAAIDARGDRRIGYKVGSTSKPGQRSFGIDEPIYAGLFQSSHAADLATALAAPLLAPSVECEIAFRLGAPIDARRGAPSRDAVIAAIATCCIACEIIDNRYGDPMAVGVPALLADDFFHASFVLGPEKTDWQQLAWTELDAAITIDGATVTGHSSGVLDALSSLQWLAGKLAQSDLALAAGDIVMSGSIVTPTPIKLPAREVTLRIDGFAPLAMSTL